MFKHHHKDATEIILLENLSHFSPRVRGTSRKAYVPAAINANWPKQGYQLA